MKKIPVTLIYSRICIGIFLCMLSLSHIANYEVYAISFLVIGLLTDIFDGIIARRLNISSEKLRRLDSIADQIFWILVAVATFIECPGFFKNNAVKLIILMSVEASTYLISYLKFGKEVATHAISSKIWTLILCSTLIQIMATCNSEALFQVCFYVGLITRFEIIAIMLVLKNWTNDVPSIYHAFLLRKGKTIKRHKLFNG